MEGLLTMMSLIISLTLDIGSDIAAMSAAVVSTGTVKMSSIVA